MKPKKAMGLKTTSIQKQSHEPSACLIAAAAAAAALAANSTNKKDTASSNLCSSAPERGSTIHTCSGCNKLIKREKYLLKACDKYWHENCLKCDQCHAKLGELGSSLYIKSNMILCRQDFLDLFGPSCVCAVCEKLIRASEMVMRAKHNVYHLECFACQLCNQRFCVGDRFYLCENKVICQFDYDEHIIPIQRSMVDLSTASSAEMPPLGFHLPASDEMMHPNSNESTSDDQLAHFQDIGPLEQQQVSNQSLEETTLQELTSNKQQQQQQHNSDELAALGPVASELVVVVESGGRTDSSGRDDDDSGGGGEELCSERTVSNDA